MSIAAFRDEFGYQIVLLPVASGLYT